MTRDAKTESPENALRFTVSSPRDKECIGLAAGGTQQKPFDFLGVLCGIWESAVAGASAGAVVETVLYPIDTIKTRLQAVRGGGGIILKGLYSGLAGNLVGVIPASAIFIGVYEPTKQKLLKILPENFSAIAHLAAGAVGGAASSIVRVPTEVIKQRIQTGQFVSAPEAVRRIVAKEGFRGLYAGFGSFLLRDLPFDAIQFCIYEQLRIGYKLAARRDLNDPETAIIGAFAGAITGAMTTPLDVIKTRLMVQGSDDIWILVAIRFRSTYVEPPLVDVSKPEPLPLTSTATTTLQTSQKKAEGAPKPPVPPITKKSLAEVTQKPVSDN
ncbi:putative S-adenosylmethionine carrier 2, chloroplastic [Orobanche minor]